MRKRHAELGSTVKAFEAIAQPSLSPPPSSAYLETSNRLAMHNPRIARKRAEKLEMFRLAGKLTAIEAGVQQRSGAERENVALREQIKSLAARISDLEKAQRATAEASKADPAVSRLTNR